MVWNEKLLLGISKCLCVFINNESLTPIVLITKSHYASWGQETTEVIHKLFPEMPVTSVQPLLEFNFIEFAIQQCWNPKTKHQKHHIMYICCFIRINHLQITILNENLYFFFLHHQ